MELELQRQEELEQELALKRKCDAEELAKTAYRLAQEKKAKVASSKPTS